MSTSNPATQILRLPITAKGRDHLRLCHSIASVWTPGLFFREEENESLFSIDWDEQAEVVETAPMGVAR